MAGNGNQNRGFKLRFDEMREGNPAHSDEAKDEQANADSYGGPGHVRNLCFVWPDGKKLFLNYAYLVSGKFAADSETNTINLGFTSHLVTLKGYQLEDLFFALMEQLPRIIKAEDARYKDANESKTIVTDIEVSSAEGR